MNYFVLDRTTLTLREKLHKENYKRSYEHIFNMWEARKARWREMAKDCPSLYQYLKTHIHKGEE